MSEKIHRSFKQKISLHKFNILVVDDDHTSLSIVAALLKTSHYKAMTVKSPLDALATVRARHDRIDLVLTDLHMPEMNGIELQKQIQEECNHMPVIIMSSDDRESVILESLASGAVFYIVKPINPDDLKSVCQYAVASTKRKSMHIEEIGSIHSGGSFAHKDVSSASSVNQETHEMKKRNKRKYSRKGKESMEEENPVAPKKAKLVWTDSLRNLFLHAINHISLEKAVPKKILECMNVPGLTRENVASHLQYNAVNWQKYRIFLKQVAEKGASVTSKNYSTKNKITSTSFAASGQSSLLLLNHSPQDSQQFQGKQPMRASFQPAGYGGRMWALNGANIGARLGASSSSAYQVGSQLENQANVYQPNFGSTNPLYPANSTTFGKGSNGFVHYLPPNYSGMPITDPMEALRISQTTPNVNFLNGGSGFISLAHNDNMRIGPTRSAPVAYFPPGKPSTVGFYSTNYPFQPALACVNQQGSNLALSQVQLQQYDRVNGGQNNASVFGYPWQLGEGKISDILLGTTNYPFPNQQQGGEGFLSPNFPSNSNFGEVNSQRNPSMNQGFSTAVGVETKNEPILEEARNPDLENGKPPIDDYFPSFNPNPDYQQQGNEEQVNFERNGLVVDNVLSGNQEWNDDFLNSLFVDRPF